MRVLVTGATGYLGRAVVLALLDGGHQVTALTYQTGAELPDTVEQVRGDITDQESVRAAVRGTDGVCHFAAMARAREAASNPGLYYRVNVTGTLNLLDAMLAEADRTGAPGRLLFASSAAIYGLPARQPITEDTPPEPLNAYGATKRAAEDAIGWHAATGGLGATVLRIFNGAGAVAGHGDPDLSRIIPKAVAVAAGRAAHVDVNGDGSAVRDFVHAADIADAAVRGLHHAPVGEATAYNVGATGASVREIITATERVTGRAVATVEHPANPHEAPKLIADTTRLRADLGWAPTRSAMHDLIADQWATARSNAQS